MQQDGLVVPVRVAVVGIGNIGSVHANCYRDDPRAELVAVVDIVPEKADAAAAEHGCRAFHSVQEFLEAGIDVDAVSVCTAGVENGGDHYEPTMQLLGAGIPVLGEKPISNDLARAEEMVAKAREANVAYGINLNHRFTPAARLAREWVDSGRLGELNIINMTMWINNPNETAQHFHMRALHPHSFDVMRYFGGDIRSIQAFFKKGTGRATWSNVQVNVLFENGIIGHLTGSYDAGPGYGLETCEVVGSEGRLVINEACERLAFYPRHSAEVEEHDHPGGMQHFGETFASRIGAWLADIQAGTAPAEIDAKADDALKAQTAIEAAIKSWNEGSVVLVKEVLS
ncbi:MAG: Gfo/Idh/MocA family protein [Candidatus Dormibacteria bacterium]